MSPLAKSLLAATPRETHPGLAEVQDSLGDAILCCEDLAVLTTEPFVVWWGGEPVAGVSVILNGAEWRISAANLLTVAGRLISTPQRPIHDINRRKALKLVFDELGRAISAAVAMTLAAKARGAR